MPHSELYLKIQREAEEARRVTAAALARNETARRRATAASPPAGADRDAVTVAPSQTIAQLAAIIAADWTAVNANVYNAARPYVRAMEELDIVELDGAMYGQDRADMIVAYFLGNATGWRGPVARAVKAELKRRLK